jgi:large subunit ribosomal protein L20
MVRAKPAVASRRRRKRILRACKGFWGDRKNHIRQASDTLKRALAFNYKHRKDRKADFRRLWIVRVGIAAKINGISYSKLIDGLHKAGCALDRKMLAEMAVRDPAAFASVAQVAKAAHAA